jgi:hypothetical protein
MDVEGRNSPSVDIEPVLEGLEKWVVDEFARGNREIPDTYKMVDGNDYGVEIMDEFDILDSTWRSIETSGFNNDSMTPADIITRVNKGKEESMVKKVGKSIKKAKLLLAKLTLQF